VQSRIAVAIGDGSRADAKAQRREGSWGVDNPNLCALAPLRRIESQNFSSHGKYS
jgi:hypothetical protein